MLVWSLLSCSQSNPIAPLDFDPPAAAMSGYEPLTLRLGPSGLDAHTIEAITIGGIRAYNLDALDADTLALYVQGAPDPGLQEVVITAEGREHRFPDAFTYEAPIDAVFARVAAFGASLSQGVQGGVPVAHGTLHSPPRLVAQAAGAYLPLPLLVDPLFPTIAWSDIGPAPDCAIPSVVQHVSSAAVSVMGVLVDEQTGLIDFSRARVDPTLEAHNVAVGDTELHSMIYGPPSDPAELFVVKMVYAPDADFLDPIATSQLQLIEEMKPTLVLSTDPYANDVVQAILLSDGIDLSELTPPDEVRADLETLLSRLSATGAEVFLANLPRPTLLPATTDKRSTEIAAARDRAEASGEDPDEAEAEATVAIDAALAEIEAAALAHNANLASIAAGYPNIHVVDFASAVADLESEPMIVAGQPLTARKFDGLLSTDGVHFGDVGYGLVAQLFLDSIADALDLTLPAIDLDALYGDDPYSPEAARAAGFDPDACGD